LVTLHDRPVQREVTTEELHFPSFEYHLDDSDPGPLSPLA
jgi:hypothetical protein